MCLVTFAVTFLRFGVYLKDEARLEFASSDRERHIDFTHFNLAAQPEAEIADDSHFRGLGGEVRCNGNTEWLPVGQSTPGRTKLEGDAA